MKPFNAIVLSVEQQNFYQTLSAFTVRGKLLSIVIGKVAAAISKVCRAFPHLESFIVGNRSAVRQLRFFREI